MKAKPTALDWIAALVALVLLIALFTAPIWYAMAMGIGIRQAAWILLRGAGSVMVMMTGARLARGFKRPK